jgi:hypothetical protein
MPAALVKKQLGDEIWNDYKKFCVVRNPYDKTVSLWWQNVSPAQREALINLPFEEVKKTFAEWVTAGHYRLAVDRKIYTIGGQLCVDFVIRYEHLAADLESACSKLGVEFDLSKLGNYKGGVRLRSEHFSEYFDSRTARKVSDSFAFEFDQFGYARLGQAEDRGKNDARAARRDREARDKRQRLRNVNSRLQLIRRELSTLKSERQQLTSELPRNAATERGASAE